MKWDQEKFNQFIITQKVLGFFKEPIRLKSGRYSYWYVNWRNVAEDVYSIDLLSDFVIAFINYLRLKPDCFYGVPEGATKLGIICQYKWAISQPNYKRSKYLLAMGRGKPKDHGAPKDQFFLGMPKGKVIILEDVTTTGSSLIETIDKLKKIDISILATIGLTNRNELREDKKSVELVIKEKGVRYYAMSDAIDLLRNLKPDKDVAQKIEEYFKKYGTRKIKLSYSQ